MKSQSNETKEEDKYYRYNYYRFLLLLFLGQNEMKCPLLYVTHSRYINTGDVEDEDDNDDDGEEDDNEFNYDDDDGNAVTFILFETTLQTQMTYTHWIVSFFSLFFSYSFDT